MWDQCCWQRKSYNYHIHKWCVIQSISHYVEIIPFSVAIDPALTTTVVFSKTDVEATGKPNNQDEIGRQC